ncbi:MAG: hypothetical protein IJY55_03040 [Clostridia bacterium]|nr:hypothetical protein [Clostridia bacterium]
MGNSLLDIIVFGRNVGKNTAAKAKDVKVVNSRFYILRSMKKKLHTPLSTPK